MSAVGVPKFRAALLHPRHWLTWFGIIVWALLAQLPYRVSVFLGKHLGRVMLRFNHKRRKIAVRDIELCFPEKTPAEQQQLLRESFESLGIAGFEIAIAWFWPRWRRRKLYSLAGRDNVERAKAESGGVLLVGMHLTTLDIGSAFMGGEFRISAMYRKNRNPVYDWVQACKRQSYNPEGALIPSDNTRLMIKTLRSGGTIWYAPDQDHGAKGSVFVDFMGVQAAMLTATATFAKLGKAAVVPFYQKRLPDAKGYELVFLPALENFPSGDDVADAQIISDFVASVVRDIPEQYLWIQRRFKTRPEGQPSFYR